MSDAIINQSTLVQTMVDLCEHCHHSRRPGGLVRGDQDCH